MALVHLPTALVIHDFPAERSRVDGLDTEEDALIEPDGQLVTCRASPTRSPGSAAALRHRQRRRPVRRQPRVHRSSTRSAASCSTPATGLENLAQSHGHYPGGPLGEQGDRAGGRRPRALPGTRPGLRRLRARQLRRRVRRPRRLPRAAPAPAPADRRRTRGPAGHPAARPLRRRGRDRRRADPLADHDLPPAQSGRPAIPQVVSGHADAGTPRRRGAHRLGRAVGARRRPAPLEDPLHRARLFLDESRLYVLDVGADAGASSRTRSCSCKTGRP